MRRSVPLWWVSHVLIAVLWLGILWAAVPRAVNAWLRHTDAVYPNTANHGGVQLDRPIHFLGVGGPSWRDPSMAGGPDARAAYHVIFLFGRASVTQIQSTSGGSGYRHTAQVRWRVERDGAAEEVEFQSDYDVVRRRVTIADETYRVSRGNVFVVRLDGGSPRVAQVDTLLTEGMQDVGAVWRAAGAKGRPDVLAALRETGWTAPMPTRAARR